VKITDILLEEHVSLLRLLDACQRAGNSGDGERLAAALATFRPALLTHADLEDELLFSALEPHFGSDGGPLAVMRTDHLEIDQALAALSGRPREQGVTGERLRRLASLVRHHFLKEEQVLFVLAGDVLGDAELERLGTAWVERIATAPVNLHSLGEGHG
jgi:hemerythrin-like domain-containing protein